MNTQEQKTLAAEAKEKRGDNGIKINKVLVVQPPKRETVGVDNWRNFIKQADKGKRYGLVTLLLDLLLDPVLADALDRRTRKITNNDIVFLSNGDEINEMYDLIDSPEFENLLKELVLTKGFGKSAIELAFSPKFEIYSIPRQNLNTKTKMILKDISQEEGISYENDEFILNIGDDNDLGFLTRVAPYVIFKRNGGSDYAQFCELWGSDAIAYLYDPDDENGRKEMESTAANRGSGASFVMSKNGDIKTISSGSSGAVHDTFLKWLDEQILIGVIGQTMTTKNGSSLSQSKVHQQTEEEIAEADRRFVQRILNTYLVPILAKRGYPVKDGFFKFVEKDNTPLKEKLDIALKVNKVTQEGVDDEYLYNTFGLPKGNKTKRAAEKPKPENDPGTPPEEGEKGKDNKRTKVKAKNLSAFGRLRNFFAHAPR